LSPCLAEADAVRRILPPSEFAQWLTAFLPSIDLEPTRVTDPTDGKLYHLAGLNLSRAWMLEGIVSKLPPADARRQSFTALARKLKEAGLDSIKSEHYEGGHWLGSFAVYLVSGRGLRWRLLRAVWRRWRSGWVHSHQPQWIGLGASLGLLAGFATLFVVMHVNRRRWLAQG